MSSEDLQQGKKRERVSLDKLSEDEVVEFVLNSFDHWVSDYAMHLKVGINPGESGNLELEKSRFHQKSRDCKGIVLRTWQNIINLATSSDKSFEKVHAKFDELCSLHNFLEPCLRGEFGDSYGLQAKAYSDDLALKLTTPTDLVKLRKVFRELVHQGLIAEGAEILVEKRITNFLIRDPVPVGVKQFNWLESLNILKILTSRLDLPKRDIEKHFLNKGYTLNPRSLHSGGNPKDEIHSKMVNEILNRAGF